MNSKHPPTLRAYLEGIGFWASGLPGWQAACELAKTGSLPDEAPARPSPQLLAANERRRAPESVAVALDVALAACQMAGRDAASLPSVFVSTHGDLGITDYMSQTLASGDPASVSPTRFHNSVHNAAAGYWTIGAGCMYPTTAISAGIASFAQGLLEALTQLQAGEPAVLLAAYDARAHGPLAEVSRSEGLLGGALLLAQTGTGVWLEAWLEDGQPDAGNGVLARHASANAMAPMLPLFDLLALGHDGEVRLAAGAGRVLRVRIGHDGDAA
ncbi:hypothetical protein CO614_06840 [Lysobacteraceae bacterium NML120232]|nr:hypothetical protein CO608_07545 [Xanthomonadaceae bacterium NML08-0793]PJK11668.1 hypothetical protein CO614_06840 [Xanthomonadaceae bacterium NML120232]